MSIDHVHIYVHVCTCFPSEGSVPAEEEQRDLPLPPCKRIAATLSAAVGSMAAMSCCRERESPFLAASCRLVSDSLDELDLLIVCLRATHTLAFVCSWAMPQSSVHAPHAARRLTRHDHSQQNTTVPEGAGILFIFSPLCFFSGLVGRRRQRRKLKKNNENHETVATGVQNVREGCHLRSAVCDQR